MKIFTHDQSVLFLITPVFLYSSNLYFLEPNLFKLLILEITYFEYQKALHYTEQQCF